jgi:uncharacterized protein YceK
MFPMKKLLIIAAGLVLAASISGCASVQQAIQAYGSVAVTGARAANDTVIEAQKVSFCGLPYSALQRHPEIQPAVQTLCGPLGAAPEAK